MADAAGRRRPGPAPDRAGRAAGEDGPDDIEHGGLAALTPSTVDFTPPFLRAIAYYEAPLAHRRAAHAVLADVLTARGAPVARPAAPGRLDRPPGPAWPPS